MTSNISLPPITRFEFKPLPSYVVVRFKDIFEILDTIGTSRTLIIQDCEEAYTLLGYFLLMNQGVKYVLFKDSIQLATENEYVFVLQPDCYIYHSYSHVDGTDDYYLRGKS